jgi:hypothetical protein
MDMSIIWKTASGLLRRAALSNLQRLRTAEPDLEAKHGAPVPHSTVLQSERRRDAEDAIKFQSLVA